MPNEKPKIDESSLAELNALLKSVDLKDVTAESVGIQPIEDGYYLSKVDKAELTISKKGNMQVAMQLSIIDKGFKEDETEDKLVETRSYKNRKIFKYFPLTDSQSIQRFVTDMLKFEDEPGHSILPKEAFMDASTMEDAISILSDMQIYVNVSNTYDENDESKIVSTWYNLVSWKRAAALELPVD